MKTLRIVFCVLSCLTVASVVPLGVFFGWYCLFALVGAAIFAGGMLLCKRASEPKAPPKPDFMNSDEENEKRRAAFDEISPDQPEE